METPNLTRREMLSRFGIAAAGGTLAGAWTARATESDHARLSPAPGAINVRDSGAAGDGSTDDTAAFASALLAAAQTGQCHVFVPRGEYLIAGQLEIPPRVMLEGVFQAPSAVHRHDGSVLLAVAGAGDAEGKPFLTLNEASALRGLTN